MPPKKATTTAPTRRSARVASREASKEPSVEPVAPACTVPPPAPAATAPKKRETASHSTEESIRKIRGRLSSERGAKKLAQTAIKALTRDQCEAVILSLAQQMNDVQDVNEDQAEEISYLNTELVRANERARPSIRRDALIKKIESVGPGPQSPIPELEPEETSTPLPVAAITAPHTPTARAVSAVQSPQQASSQESPPAAPAAVVPAFILEIEPARPAQPSPWRKIVSGLSGYIPGLRKRKADDEAATPDSTPKRVRVVEPETTPISRPSPRTGVMRSAKNPEVPTSLSTITEYSEPSSMMEDTTPTAPQTTPSKSRPTTSSHTTSNHTTSNHTTSNRTSSTRTTSVTPMRRSAAAIRMARENRQLGASPAPRPYAWEKNVAKAKPKEPNADARLAKLQQLQELEAKAKQAQQDADDLKAEMALMKQDADIKDIEAHSAHRRKRVKVDHLKVIPHNRPGDSSGTFRVPDINSDDEMSVDEDVEEDSNIFDELEKRYEEAQDKIPVQTPRQPPMPTTAQPTTAQTPRTVEQAPPAFTFPSVAKKPDDYHVSEEFKEAAGDAFAQGLAAFISA